MSHNLFPGTGGQWTIPAIHGCGWTMFIPGFDCDSHMWQLCQGSLKDSILQPFDTCCFFNTKITVETTIYKLQCSGVCIRIPVCSRIGILCEVITAVADAEKNALQVSWTTAPGLEYSESLTRLETKWVGLAREGATHWFKHVTTG